MKQKKFQYLLFLLVAAVWGGIGYQFYNHIAEPEILNNKSFQSKFAGPKDSIKIFELILDYQNPFVEIIGDELQMNSYIESNGENPDISEYIQKPTVDWPQIQYSGYISNKSKPELRQVLVRITEFDYFFNKGQEINGITLVNAYKDSAVFSYKSELKTIKKNDHIVSINEYGNY